MFEAKALFQMKFYALVIWRTRGVVPAMLQLVYLGNGEMLRYVPDEADLLATERKVEALWQAIRARRRRPATGGPTGPGCATGAPSRRCAPSSAARPRRCPSAPATPASLTEEDVDYADRRSARPRAPPGSGRRRRSAGTPRSGAPSRCAR